MEPLKVALMGCGVVGSQVARLLIEKADALEARCGRRLELVGIGARVHPDIPGAGPSLFTADLDELLDRPGLDIVIELIGGIEPARTLILRAIENGASVVTANKALLAEHGASLYAAAEDHGVDLYYEAAVAGAIPIIRPLRESLVGDEVTAVMGIVNGTTNYILDKMHTEGASFADALAKAQELGFAEADPTADVEGFDAAAKAAILASLSFHTQVSLSDVDREGITQISVSDIAAAQDMGCVIKLLARCARSADGTIAVGVHPTMVPKSHPLSNVSGAFNAVFIESRNAGQLMFMGAGAGGTPTASAVLGDVVTAGRNRVRGVAGPSGSSYGHVGITAAGEVASRFYLSVQVEDEPGVLAAVASCFARHGVSLQAVRQDASPLVDGRKVALLGIMTHQAPTKAIEATIAYLASMPDVLSEVSYMRVEGM